MGVRFLSPALKTMKDEDVVQAATCCISMREAAETLGIHYLTFRSAAQRLGVWRPRERTKPKEKFPLSEVLAGMHPTYYLRRERLFREGIKERKCEGCNGTHWLNALIPLELDHINGDSSDHRLENLRILCPNCHAQTSTYRGKNRGAGAHTLRAKARLAGRARVILIK